MTKHLPQDERRQQILDAARHCFIQNGYAKTRMDDIARAASLSKGGVYFHFDAKRDIFDALLEQQVESTMQRLALVEQTNAPLTEKLAAFGAELTEHLGGDEDHRKFITVIAEMGLRDPAVLALLAEQHERYLGLLERWVQEAVDQGEIRDVDVRGTAQLLKALVDGIEQEAALGYRLDLPRTLLVAIDVLRMGLKPR
jgi:AcrR family transcriptional regulator